MSHTFLEAISQRRSNYLLDNISPVATTQILDTIDTVLSVVPSPFNVQSARIVVLFDEQHIALWDIVEQALKSRIPADIFERSRQKLHRSFRAGFGTILIYEDIEVLNQLRINVPDYAENVDRWSEQSSGMLQFALWTALEDMGLGASLQHYNPLIDKAVSERWLINDSWRLIAQMPFGLPKDNPVPHIQKLPIHQRRLVFGFEE